MTQRRPSAMPLRALGTITCRWEITIMIMAEAVGLFLFGQMAVGGPVEASRLIVAGLFGLFAQGLCSVLNDITDREGDQINHPERPLPAGRVSVGEAWGVVITCLLGTITTGVLLASSWFSYVVLAGHVVTSILYSLPGARFGRYWHLGPLTLVTSTVFFIVFVLSTTALFEHGEASQHLVFLIGGVCFVQHLFVIPLKDIKDLEGDTFVGRSSLAMRLPRGGVHALGVLGYLLPWVILYWGADALGMVPMPRLASALQTVALVFGALGLVMSYLIVFRSKLLEVSQRFCWFAELGILFLFQVTLPIAAML